ncbi:MAG: DNA cytosine methyltransferase [Saprospiraceae bacterium]
MRVLVACEYSGAVRDAFLRAGHDAMSCDLLPTDVPGPHYQGDVADILADGWDLMIAHPPCTYLCSSGLHWNKRVPGRAALTVEALEFVRLLLSAPIPRIALENPIGCISTRIRRPDQTIQPWQFGHDASKATCLWLQGLPPLVPTAIVEPRMVNGKKRWANQTDSGQNRLPPSADRWKIRSETYQGIADAMAAQWGSLA